MINQPRQGKGVKPLAVLGRRPPPALRPALRALIRPQVAGGCLKQGAAGQVVGEPGNQTIAALQSTNIIKQAISEILRSLQFRFRTGNSEDFLAAIWRGPSSLRADRSQHLVGLAGAPRLL